MNGIEALQWLATVDDNGHVTIECDGKDDPFTSSDKIELISNRVPSVTVVSPLTSHVSLLDQTWIGSGRVKVRTYWSASVDPVAWVGKILFLRSKGVEVEITETMPQIAIDILAYKENER